jgi:hypothetical protein
MGRNDQKDGLKEFAKGEDVGHGADHDCPACRKNRQALKLAGLKASDIRGLEGGKAPAGNGAGQPPQATTAFVSPGVSTDPNDKPLTGDGSGTALPPIDTEAAAQGIADQVAAASANPPTDFTPEDIARTDAQDRRSFDYAQRHHRFVALASKLEEVLTKTMVPRGFDASLLDGYENDEIDLGQAIVEQGGRFMLMAGFIPDDRDWHCEVGIGSERSHVKHPHRSIAIRLATLLALDPRGGAALNSAFIQLLAEDRQQTATAGHWGGVGVQP